MKDKVRLRNPQKFNVGIVTLDNPVGMNIAPGAFTVVSRDDVDFIMGTSTLLQKGVLQVEGDQKEEVMESLGVITENNANFMSDEDIKKKLTMNANSLKKWLESTQAEPYVLNRIAEIASGMNLSMNKIQVLKDKIPGFEFIK